MRRAESESEDRASRKPLDQTSPHGLQGPGSSRWRQLQPRLGTRKTREEGSGGRGWRGALPRRRRRQARAGRGVRQSGRRPGPAQGSAARGLQASAWEDWLGQEAAPHVPLGPPRGGEAAAAGGVPAWRPLRPPRRGGSSGRTMHSRLSCERRPPLALWSFQSLLCRWRGRS